MENIKQTINRYIRSIKRNHSYPYSKNDVDNLHKKMKEVYSLAGKDFTSFENAFKNKKITDVSYMFNYSAVSFEGMLNNFFMSSVTKWIDSNYEFFDKSYFEKSDTCYCIEGPLPKDKFIELFKEVGVRDSDILLSVYELKEPLTSRFNYEEEKDMRKAARYTRVVFPKPNNAEFPWSKVKYWFFNNIINKKLLSKIPPFNPDNYKLNYINNNTDKKHNWKEIVMVDKRIKYKDLFTKFRAPGYNISFEVKVDEEFAKIESMQLNADNYHTYDLDRHLRDQVK